LTAADPANDVIPIVDVSDTSMAASGTTKKISVNNILGASGTATLASATITGALTVGAAANFNGGATAGYLNGSLLFGSGSNIVNFYAQSSGFAFKDNTGANNLLTISTAGVFGFLDGAGGTRMTLNSFGLGIGIASSGGRLVVRDAGGNDSYIGYGATNDIYLSSGSTGSHYFRKAAASAAMTLDASGRLLVGKTSGVNKIETVGAGIDGSGNVSVSTSATTIYAMKQVNTPAMCVVSGDDGSSGFCDIVLFLSANAPKVVSSQTMYGTPPARTYTASSSNLQLALASGTQNIRTAALSTLTA
jgi:hypothetical protein